LKDVLDVHTHTTASGHAYSTFHEVIEVAKKKNLQLIGIADHAHFMPGTCHDFYFLNFKNIPRDAHGIKLVMGAELNIIDYSGSTDLPAQILKGLDYAVASLHNPCIDPGSVAENTAAIIGGSYKSVGYRAGSRENAKLMLESCKKYNASVIMGSDAHIDIDVGNHSLSQAVIAENNFPEDLVVNSSVEKFFDFVNYRKSLAPK